MQYTAVISQSTRVFVGTVEDDKQHIKDWIISKINDMGYLSFQSLDKESISRAWENHRILIKLFQSGYSMDDKDGPVLETKMEDITILEFFEGESDA